MAEGSPADPGHFFARVLADQHYQKGLQRQEQGSWELALVSYRRACALDPHNVLYLLARGHVCQAHGLEREAEDCYRVALELRPDDTVALYNQAQLLAARGELDAARLNLGKIVASGVDALGERATPVYCRLGDIAMRREDFVAAGVHFRRALECTPGHRYAGAALGGLERFAEFQRPFDEDGGIQPKVAFYGYAGAMLLGLPDDDGIAVPAYPGLGFDSLAELAHTLSRFTTLAARLRWRFAAVTPLDAESQPLAIGLAGALGLRTVAPEDVVSREEPVLAVTGTASDPQALARTVEALRERTGRALLYAVGVALPVWEYLPAIQVASAPSRLEFPWSRREAAVAEHAEAIGAELGEAIRDAPPDGTAGAQLRWYGATADGPSERDGQDGRDAGAGGAGHARLGFDPRTLELSPEPVAGRRLLDCIV